MTTPADIPHPPTPETPHDDFAPIESAYDIDPLTPLTHAPNPIPTEVERDLLHNHQKPLATPKLDPEQA